MRNSKIIKIFSFAVLLAILLGLILPALISAQSNTLLISGLLVLIGLGLLAVLFLNQTFKKAKKLIQKNKRKEKKS